MRKLQIQNIIDVFTSYCGVQRPYILMNLTLKGICNNEKEITCKYI